VDRSVVEIRDAFAHGRLLSVGDVFPATLWKFGISRDGKVPIEFREVLSTDWMKTTRDRIRIETLKIVNCFNARGYPGVKMDL
jgi:hypothetical protein